MTRITSRQISEWLGPRDRLAALAVGGLALALGWTRFGMWQAVPLGILGAVVVAITLIDWRRYLIPDRLSLPLIPLGLVHAAQPGPVWPNLLAMAVVWAALKLLASGFSRLRGKTGIGGGDIKLIVAAAAWLPWDILPDYLLAAALTGLAEALWRRANHQRPIAFGAHLAPWLLILVFAG